ncbi:MAG: alpha-hydroxy acid oxidase [Pseudomonadota bacterium]
MVRLITIADYESAARRRLPASVWEFLSGGVEDNVSRERSRAAFARRAFRPRVLRDVSACDASIELFGHRYAAPIGLAPTGFNALLRRRCDALLAEAFAAANQPHIVSGVSSVPIEELARINPNAWYQGYLPGDRDRIDRTCARLEEAGVGTLVVTADVPVMSNRENIERRDFTAPFRPTWRLALDGALHPRWSLEVFAATLMKDGIPRLVNLGDDRTGARVTEEPPQGLRTGRDRLDWDTMAWLCGRWTGRLILKGVLEPEDAVRAADIGFDGVMVSNHGGRQLDYAPAALDALPGVVAAAGDRLTVMMDGGVRRGTHVLMALALGAQAVFAGRPFLHAAAVGGGAGLDHMLALFRKEILIDLALLGCPRAADLGLQHLFAPDPAAPDPAASAPAPAGTPA